MAAALTGRAGGRARGRLARWLGARLDARARARWARRAAGAGTLSPGRLAALGREAEALGAQLDRLNHAIAARRPGQVAPPATGPEGSDWAWRPAPWGQALHPGAGAGVASGTELAPGVTLFHDCPLAEITWRQQQGEGGIRGLALDVLGFEGGFLSLAIDLPPEALAGLDRSQIVQAAGPVLCERPLELFARLNLRHGPNTTQIVDEMPRGARQLAAEFDLAYAEFQPARLEGAWLDLIFEAPAMNRIVLGDLVLSRWRRAEL